MSLMEEFNELNEFTKLSQRWKGQKTELQPAEQSVCLSNTHTVESCESEPSLNLMVPNPWRDSNKVEVEVKKQQCFEKVRVRTHTPQVIDEDTEQFKLKLEHLLNVFKTEATSEFMQMKRSMLDDQKQTIKQDTQKYLQMYEEKTSELQETKLQLQDKIKEATQLQEKIEKMASTLGNIKTSAKSMKQKQFLFSLLKNYKKYRQLKKYKIKLSISLRKRTLSKFILEQWKTIQSIEISNKKDQKVHEQHRQEMDDLIAKFQKEEEMLQTRLREAMQGLDEANKLKVGMQDNLKRAFMRGVCALNFEAMSVIQNGPQMSEADVQEIQNNSFLTMENNSNCFNAANMLTQTVQFHNQNRIETNEHKWKGAPMIGQAQQPKAVLNQKENIEPQMPQFTQQIQQMPIQNLVQQNDEMLDRSFQKHQEEGRVIKVNIHNEQQSKVKTESKPLTDSKKGNKPQPKMKNK